MWDWDWFELKTVGHKQRPSNQKELETFGQWTKLQMDQDCEDERPGAITGAKGDSEKISWHLHSGDFRWIKICKSSIIYFKFHKKAVKTSAAAVLTKQNSRGSVLIRFIVSWLEPLMWFLKRFCWGETTLQLGSSSCSEMVEAQVEKFLLQVGDDWCSWASCKSGQLQQDWWADWWRVPPLECCSSFCVSTPLSELPKWSIETSESLWRSQWDFSFVGGGAAFFFNLKHCSSGAWGEKILQKSPQTQCHSNNRGKQGESHCL